MLESGLKGLFPACLVSRYSKVENPLLCSITGESGCFAFDLGLFTKVRRALEWRASRPGNGGLWASHLGCGLSLTPQEVNSSKLERF